MPLLPEAASRQPVPALRWHWLALAAALTVALSADAWAHQPRCTTSTSRPTGGEDGKFSDVTLEVCYYTANIVGSLVFIEEHACYIYNIGQYAT